MLSASTPLPLSNLERDAFFETLSRLVDEYLIASQIVERWGYFAIALGCSEDVETTRTTFEMAKRIGGFAADYTEFEVPNKKRIDAARSAAHLVFLEVLNGGLKLVDCDYDRCGRRFIFGTLGRTRFDTDSCGKSLHARLTKRRKRKQHSENFHRIDIAIGAMVVWHLNKKGKWKSAVLIAWSAAEKRKDLKTRLPDYLSRRSNRVPKEIGCRLLGKIIGAALREDNSTLTQELIEECCGGSADDREHLKLVLPTLFGLIREAEPPRKPRIIANANTRLIEEDPAYVDKMVKLAKSGSQRK